MTPHSRVGWTAVRDNQVYRNVVMNRPVSCNPPGKEFFTPGLFRKPAQQRSPSPGPGSAMSFSNRWVQLVAGITGMVAVANFQYSWTLFILPMQQRHGWAEADIQYA